MFSWSLFSRPTTCVVTSQSWYFVKHFWNVPHATGLIQQLLCSPIGNRNFQRKTNQNITTERMPHCVHQCDNFQLTHFYKIFCKLAMVLLRLPHFRHSFRRPGVKNNNKRKKFPGIRHTNTNLRGSIPVRAGGWHQGSFKKSKFPLQFCWLVIGGSGKCHCKRGASYCVTVTGVTVSGEPCISFSFPLSLSLPLSLLFPCPFRAFFTSPRLLEESIDSTPLTSSRARAPLPSSNELH